MSASTSVGRTAGPRASRRQLAWIAAVVVSGLTIGACRNGDADTQGGSPTSASTSSVTSGADPDGEPSAAPPLPDRSSVDPGSELGATDPEPGDDPAGLSTGADPDAPALALAATRHVFPDVAIDDSVFQDLFELACRRAIDGFAARASPEDTAAAIEAALPYATGDRDRAALRSAASVLLFFGGCGDDPYLLEVRQALL